MDDSNQSPVSDETPEVQAVPEHTQSQAPASVGDGIASLISQVTADGMYPLLAYGIDMRGRPSRVLLVTSSIPDMVLAQEMLSRHLEEEYNLGRFVPWDRLDRFVTNYRAIARAHEHEIPGFEASRHVRLLGSIARENAASKWKQKAFGLVDVSGFSKCTIEEQLAHRTSLALALSQAASRVHRLYQVGYLPGYADFCSAPTGDGFYFWHRSPGGANDVGVFMLLIYLMTQSEAMRESRRSNMRLRGAFAVGEAFTFPSRELESYRAGGVPMQDAIGPVLNGLARLISAAMPGQVLLAEFSRPGRTERDEVLTPSRLTIQAMRQLLPSELTPTDIVTAEDIQLEFRPSDRLRVCDKHGDVHYCYNLVGSIPNRFRGEAVRIQKIGLMPDPTVDIATLAFADPATQGG